MQIDLGDEIAEPGREEIERERGRVKGGREREREREIQADSYIRKYIYIYIYIACWISSRLPPLHRPAAHPYPPMIYVVSIYSSSSTR
jgi:hypothetical protein